MLSNGLIITHIIENIKKYNPDVDEYLIKEAYQFAQQHHNKQKRKSGAPYIIHPLEVADILSTLEVDDTTIAASLLHDVIEDADVTKKEIEEKFGHNVAYLVEGVTKLGKISFASKEEVQAENFRKMFLAMATDIRVIVIKLADRLHNMRTLKYLSKEKQMRIAKETQEIYAPLAHRLGMGQIKWELEDLCFRFMNHERYLEIRNLVNEKRVEREKYIENFVDNLKKHFADSSIEARIYGRPKHFWSIYNKLIKQNIDFSELFDLFAIRAIVNSVKDCYTVLGIIHTLYKPIPGRFKDYIAMPKSNMYQSLHTTIMGPKGHTVEIQIRTHEMHKQSEYGIAAHWTYKDGKAKDKKFEAKLSWLRQLIDWQKELMSAKDFMANLKLDLFTDEAFAFTPKGDVHALSTKSTPIDFAYHVHTEVGHRCVGAKVNGKIVPLNYTLNNGDIVEILTSKKDNPNLNWINFVATNNAKSKIKAWFKKQDSDYKIKKAKDDMNIEIKKQLGILSDKYFKETIKDVLKKFKFSKEDKLYLALANDEISLKQIIDFAKKDLAKKANPNYTPEVTISKPKARKKGVDNIVDVQGIDNILVHLSKCCNPIPGDNIIGFITKGHGVSIHKRTCNNINMTNENMRTVPVTWQTSAIKERYPVDIRVEGYDKVGILMEILNEIATMKINVTKSNMRTSKTRNTFNASMTIEISNLGELEKVLNMIRQVKNVYKAYRVEK